MPNLTDPRLPSPILFYDGLCGYCDWIVKLLLRLDRDGKLHYATLQGPLGLSLLTSHPELSDIDTAVLYERSPAGVVHVSIKSGMAIRAGEYLPGFWKTLAHILNAVPRPIRDAMYDLIARNRYRIFGRYESCPIPPPEVRRRFL